MSAHRHDRRGPAARGAAPPFERLRRSTPAFALLIAPLVALSFASTSELQSVAAASQRAPSTSQEESPPA